VFFVVLNEFTSHTPIIFACFRGSLCKIFLKYKKLRSYGPKNVNNSKRTHYNILILIEVTKTMYNYNLKVTRHPVYLVLSYYHFKIGVH